MAPTIYLLAYTLIAGQAAPTDAADWQLSPNLVRGQELVFRGTYVEEAKNPGVQFSNNYLLESRVFVLETPPEGPDVAILTIWKGRPSHPSPNGELEACSVQLLRARIDKDGRVLPQPGHSLAVPFDGPPSTECGAFVVGPRGRIRKDQGWEVPEQGRPACNWQAVGVEMSGGNRCLKLVGVQQSDDWDFPRADRTGWHRQDTAWVPPRAGFAYKVERIIEVRDPARQEPTRRLVVRYELESTMQYPGQLFEDRRNEILQAQTLGDAVNALLPRAGQVGPEPFATLLKRIELYVDRTPPNPYREAIKQVQRLAEAGRRGEPPPEVQREPVTPVANVIALGKPAPDFLVTDLTTHESARLRRWGGKPILMVFYTPTSPMAQQVLSFAQQLGDEHKGNVTILALAVADDVEAVQRQRDEMHLNFPILSGQGLRLSYAVECTPKLVVLDAAGTVRASYDGWGPEIPSSVSEAVQSCMPAHR